MVRISLGREGVCRVSAPQDKQHDPNVPRFKDGAWQDAAVSSLALVLRYKISSVPFSKTLVGPAWIRWVDVENGTIKPNCAEDRTSASSEG